MKHHRIKLLLVIMFWVVFGAVISTQAQVNTPIPVLDAYRCDFVRASNSEQIRATITGADGRPIPRDNYRLSVVQIANGELVSPDLVRVNVVEQRAPIQLVIVMDVTETMPLLEIKQLLANTLAPNLLVEDEAALITFASGVSQTSPYVRDKNLLINDYIVDLERESGDNRIYDAIAQAIDSLEQRSPLSRRVVLVLTDSGRRSDNQADVDAIIASAQQSNIQVFPIGFFTRDRPDVADLERIAIGTGGYSWMYTNPEYVRSSVQSAVDGFLRGFLVTLNNEILIDVATAPIVSPETGLGGFEIALVLQSNILNDRIFCPVEELSHSISLVNSQFNLTTSDPFDVLVSYDTDLAPSEVTVAFWVDDRLVQNSGSSVFTFDTATYDPGRHTIYAQLLDRQNNVLATTQDQINVYAQQLLRIDVTDGSLVAIDQPITFEVNADPEVTMPSVTFALRDPENEALSYPLGTAPLLNGRARLRLNNIQQSIAQILPAVTEQQAVTMLITVPASSPSNPPLALPIELTFAYTPPPPVAPAFTLPSFLFPTFNRDQLNWLAIIALSITNILMLLRVRRMRIIKSINRPDKSELGDRLMSVTMTSDNGKRTVPLTKKTLFVGRGSSNDIDLGDSPRISRKHGAILWRKGRWWYANRKGDSRSVVDGKTLKGYQLVPLEPVTEIQIADVTLVFHSSAQQDIAVMLSTDLG